MSKFLRAAIAAVLAACTGAVIAAPMKELATYKRGLGKWNCDVSLAVKTMGQSGAKINILCTKLDISPRCGRIPCLRPMLRPWAHTFLKNGARRI